MRKLLLAFFSLMFINFQSEAQNVYFSLSNNAKFLKQNSNDTLKYPFVGGFQKPQFNKMDLNNDGQKDLVVFDGIGNKIFTYLWLNNSWVYAPKYEKIFPPISQWLKLLDYNCDGKEDIFTASGSAYAMIPGELVTENRIRYYQNTSTGNTFSFKQKGNCITHEYEGNVDCIEFVSSDVGVIDDINNDGKIDIVQSPSLSNYFNYFQNKRPNGNNNCDSLSFGLKALNWGHFNYKVISHGFNFGLTTNYLFKGGKHVSNSFAAYDLDGDGDKDFLYGDGLFPTLIYAKNGKELTKLDRDSMIVEDTIFPRNTYRPLDMVWPTPYFKD
ncbi:MAG: FG-GAP-like repeat-containing protein, partial [Bacteroidia bacterium]